MGHVDLAQISFVLPDGRPLLDEVSFRVGEGAVVALVGPNGTGKTTLMRIIAGDLAPHAGSVSRSGGLGIMRQFIGSVRDDTTVQRFLDVRAQRLLVGDPQRHLVPALSSTLDSEPGLRGALDVGRYGR